MSKLCSQSNHNTTVFRIILMVAKLSAFKVQGSNKLRRLRKNVPNPRTMSSRFADVTTRNTISLHKTVLIITISMRNGPRRVQRWSRRFTIIHWCLLYSFDRISCECNFLCTKAGLWWGMEGVMRMRRCRLFTWFWRFSDRVSCWRRLCRWQQALSC